MGLVQQLRALWGRAGAQPGAAEPAALSTGQLQRSRAAGLALREAAAGLAAEGRTVLDVVLDGQPFSTWQIYPRQGGILDQRTSSQYFYHSHKGYTGEHGHFHTFVYHQRKLVHLVALGMDERGRINRLYTFNRWAPGDHYLPAAELKRLLPRFRIGPGNALDGRLHAFINGALGLFRAEIEFLFDQRDATFARYRERHGGASPFEDRSLEITSALAVDAETRLRRIAAELERRGAADAPPDAAAAAAPPPPADAQRSLAGCPTPQLRRSLEAGQALQALLAGLRERGRTLPEAVMNGRPYQPWSAYPWDGGVIDRKSRSQYFYHAHPGAPEHGHFHVFHRQGGRLAHLVAISLDDRGQPVGLFTVNRWVTGDEVVPAATLERYLAGFRIDTDAFDREVGDAVQHLLRLFQAEIGALLHERERTFAGYRAAHGGRAPWEDRDLEVTSALEIGVEAQLARLRAELARRGGG